MVAGEHAGKDAEVTVTVKSIKERELPEPDDEFAQLASEFDTIDELKASLTEQVERVKRIHQAEQIRTTPWSCCWRRSTCRCPRRSCRPRSTRRAQRDPWSGPRRGQVRRGAGGPGQLARAVRRRHPRGREKAVKTQLLMDAIADDLEIQVGQNDLTERLVLMSRQYGIEPAQLLQILQQNKQLPAMFADVRRGLTVAAVVEAATVTDTDGNVVDTSEFFGRRPVPKARGAEVAEGEEAAADDEARASLATPTPRTSRRGRITPSAKAHPLGVRFAGGWLGSSRTSSSSRSVESRYQVVTHMRSGGAPGLNLTDSVYERLLAERIIFLGSQVDDDIANRLCAQILLLAAEDPTKDISLYINSPGGSISAGMAIYDTMVLAPCDVATYAMGMAASMGEFLLAAGAKGKRFALPHARILMHQPLGGITGGAADIAIQAEQFALIKKEMFRLNAEFTGQPIERIEADSDRDGGSPLRKPSSTASSTTSSPAPT